MEEIDAKAIDYDIVSIKEELEYILSLLEKDEELTNKEESIKNLEDEIKNKEETIKDLEEKIEQGLSQEPPQDVSDLENQKEQIEEELKQAQEELTQKKNELEQILEDKSLVDLKTLNEALALKINKNGDESINGIKTFTENAVFNKEVQVKGALRALLDLIITRNLSVTGTTTLNNTLTANGTTNLNGNTTFKLIPNCEVNPTADTHLARKWYVDYGGGIKNLGTVGSTNIDLIGAQHFMLTANAGTQIGVANWGGAGKSGTITIHNCQNVTAFKAPFNFRIPQSGFSGTETFAYFCIAANNIRLVRS
ncbi:hypothetical protein IY804_07515 [Campylobacter volucris]|uniref:coiled-coil domain-containing protein n=1 Tax=Campylobacter volucris TaxID=1031542 RepID=UPI00189D2F2F|nr:hypothetical protein [Campylobacter volucris]MBF7047918.1 hypothetical protein [Campylobacter volucris]